MKCVIFTNDEVELCMILHKLIIAKKCNNIYNNKRDVINLQYTTLDNKERGD